MIYCFPAAKNSLAVFRGVSLGTPSSAACSYVEVSHLKQVSKNLFPDKKLFPAKQCNETLHM